MFEMPFLDEGIPATTKTASGYVEHATNNEMELLAVMGGIKTLGIEEPYEILIKTDMGVKSAFSSMSGRDTLYSSPLSSFDLARSTDRTILKHHLRAGALIRWQSTPAVAPASRPVPPVSYPPRSSQ